MTMIIFDLVLASILLFAAIQGYRRGFILTLCGFLAIFVAFFGATFLSNALAEPVSEAIRPAIETSITQSIEQSLEEHGHSSFSPSGGEADGVPALSLDEILQLLQDSSLVQYFSKALYNALGHGVLEMTSDAVHTMSAYIAREIARLILFLLCFFLVLGGWFLLSRTLDLAFRLPVLSTLNHWSGAALGLCKGGVLLFIACWLFRGLIPPPAIEQTVLLRLFCTTNPLSLMAVFFL